MGKVATTAIATVEMKTTTTTTKQHQKLKMKKKGRPSTKNPSLLSSTNRRSTRRNPNHLNFDEDEDEDERKEKKVKLVVRLPESSSADDKSNIIIDNNLHNHSGDYDDSGSDSDSDPEPQDPDSYANKRKINAVDRGSAHPFLNQEMKAEKTTDDSPLHGSPLETGPTTPLPDKKLLVFILDRLQKKDTYGVFSEPVDPSELPDYFEIIEQPMDFGTLRKKLDDGAYKNLEELEADVFLICSNAMQYNAPDTVYHRQARSIQDIAKRDFENLRHEGDDGEPQPKVVRRGRPPSSKNQKKPLEKTFETSPVDRVGTELSSGVTLASGEDKATGSNSYNLRKASTLYRFRPTDPFVSSHRSRNGENYSEWVADWNDEFPASILRADMKYGKKHFTVDENRRDTYRQFRPLSSCNNSPVLFNSIGDLKRLVPVGLQEPLAYARSLARYAANLGPIPWKMASKKIESLLPAGVQYGRGWVGENHLAPSQPLSFSTDKQKSSNSTTAGDCSSSKLMTPSTSDLNSAVAYEPSQGTKFPVHQNPVHQSYRNGFSGLFGNNNLTTEEAKLVESKMTQGKVSDSHGEGQMWNFGKQTQQRHNNAFLVPPDLNVRVAAGSPTSSSLQIGSPQQPDLALQL
ncbi:hypothetical protein BUALT_Bualt15G0135600 [Buddleja alternifolia]|uniref:Bromo domain-containing protein n=1 Tax=Buddleja alternifolia TaxID=168488 RepID=A0AAV6WMP2_9LAMI|nr:hypothetical protein BUALT_Bualt15G0135600 [Buddleja alternifolia]